MKLLKKPKPPTLAQPSKLRKFTLSKSPAVKAAAKTSDIDAKATARAKYREDRGLENHDCRKNLADLEQFAKVQVVTFPTGKVRELPAIVATSLGEPLETTGVTITRWLKADMLPQPVIVTSRGGKAYHLEEVRIFIRVLGEHQQQFRQYRKQHTDVTDKIFREISLLRKSLF